MRRLAWLCLVCLGCAGPSRPDPAVDLAPESNQQMAATLAALAREQTNEQALFYRNDEYAALLEAPRSRFGSELIEHSNKLAVQLLRAGRTEEAINQIAQTRSMLESTDSLSEQNRTTLLRLEALAYLRLGEQDNCVSHHTIDSCLLPIEGHGVHVNQRGSRKAVELYTQLLDADPNEIGFRWLLNLAYQTLGEYPDGVPDRYRIAPEIYRGEGLTPRFNDVAAHAGLLDRTLAGGAAMDDFDGDGLLDLVASSSGVHDPLRLFVNRGDGTFEDRSAAAFLDGLNGGLNLTHADYDNDGDLDLFILRGGWMASYGEYPNSLLRNLGDGRFEDVTLAAGLFTRQPSPSASWGDYDNDGWLDLFVANETRQQPRPCELWHNNGDGTFTNRASAVGLDHAGFVKAAVWGDYDNDDDLDLFLSRIGAANLLYRNDGANDAGSWRFSEVGVAAGVTEPRKSFPAWFFDYDNDGWLDLMVATFAEFEGSALGQVAASYLGDPVDVERSRLYRNRGDGTFEDVSVALGADRVLLAMGANYGDIDNDGWLDMYFGTGEPALSTLVPNVLLRNDAGARFVDVSAAAGVASLQKGHGIAFGDYDNDGDQDIFTVMGGFYSGDRYQNILFRNPSVDAHWITLRLTGTRSNRSAVGARVKVVARRPGGETREIHRVVSSGGSFGSSSLQLEIGLGDATAIDSIEIRWPSDSPHERVTAVPVDTPVRIVEGSGRFEIEVSSPLAAKAE